MDEIKFQPGNDGRIIGFTYGRIPVFPERYGVQPKPGEVWNVSLEKKHSARTGGLFYIARLHERMPYPRMLTVTVDIHLTELTMENGYCSLSNSFTEEVKEKLLAFSQQEKVARIVFSERRFPIEPTPEQYGIYTVSIEVRQDGGDTFTGVKGTIVSLVISQDDRERVLDGMTKKEKRQIIDAFAEKHSVGIGEFTNGWAYCMCVPPHVRGPEAFQRYLDNEIAPTLDERVSAYRSLPFRQSLPDEYHPYFHDGEDW